MNARGAEDPVIVVRDLVRAFAAERAVDGLTLTVARGESLGLLGPNGAGKTTTIKILATLLPRTSGDVRVLGFDPATAPDEIRARIGVVPQEVALYDALSARENLAFFGRLNGLVGARLDERVQWALASAGLVERANDRVGVYSGGMKRRLNIVAALMHEPELVFLDEPTVGIDPQSRNHVYDMVDEIRASGASIVYTTHQMGEVERLCDRIVILDHGCAVAAGTLRELQNATPVASERRVRIDCGAASQEALALLAAHGIAVKVDEDLPGLEAVFLSLTGRALRDE